MNCNTIRPHCPKKKDIQEGDAYCRHCGAKLSAVTFSTTALQVQPERPVSGWFKYEVTGEPVTTKLKVVYPEVGVSLAHATGSLSASGQIDLKLDPLESPPDHIEIAVVSLDGERDPERPWDDQSQRRTSLRIPLRETGAEIPSWDPARLLFTGERGERRLLLWNPFDADIRVERVEYEGPFQSKSTAMDLGFVLSANTSDRKPIALDITAPDRRVAAKGSITLYLHGGHRRISIPLEIRPTPNPGFVPEVTVGIDFGTSGTSVVLRRSHRVGWDFEETGGGRFPTALYLRADKWFYGAEALKEYEKDRHGDPGELVEDLKGMLRASLSGDLGNAPETPRALLRWY